MVPTLFSFMLLAGAPQDATPPPAPRVTAVAVARARILAPTRIAFIDRPRAVPRHARRVVRRDGRVEIQFE